MERKATPKQRWTEQDDQILKDNYQLTVKEINNLLPARTIPAIRQRCKSLNLYNKIWTAKKYITEDKMELLKNNINMDVDDLSEMLGVCATTIRNTIKKHHLRDMRISKKWTNDDIEYIKSNYGKMDIHDMCNLLGRSFNSLWKKASQLGLDAYINNVEIMKRVTKGEFERLYFTEGKPVKEIAEIYNISEHQGYYIAHKYKINIRTLKESAERRALRDRGNNHPNWKGHEEITGRYWCAIKNSAQDRGLEFDITIEYVWKLFISQNRKCFFTGYELCFSELSTENNKQTASLDRIDSSKGYIEDNVQWVHKDINFMKGAASNDKFIQRCKLIASRF